MPDDANCVLWSLMTSGMVESDGPNEKWHFFNAIRWSEIRGGANWHDSGGYEHATAVLDLNDDGIYEIYAADDNGKRLIRYEIQ